MTAVVSVASVKGGIGKTSCICNIAGMAAASPAAYRVLVIDMDPQANAGRDLGYRGTDIDDDGQSLFASLHFGHPLIIHPHIRSYPSGGTIDVVVGGSLVEDLIAMSHAWENRGRQSRAALKDALSHNLDDYDLVLIDVPPGGLFLQQLALAAATHVLVPTRSDEASIDGIDRLIKQLIHTRATSNPDLMLAGCVIFGVTPQATTIERDVRLTLQTSLGSAAPVFDAVIPYTEKVAVEVRKQGVLVHEYVEALLAKKAERAGISVADYLTVHYTSKPGGGNKRDPNAPAAGLAAQYAQLTVEVLTAVMQQPDDSIDITEPVWEDNAHVRS